MKIINVVEIINGILSKIESFCIDEKLSQSNEFFFSEKKGVKKAEDLFKNLILENKINLGDNAIDFYLDEGYIDDGNGYELSIHWSAINVDEDE